MDAPLTPAEHRELQPHLATCAACRVFVAPGRRAGARSAGAAPSCSQPGRVARRHGGDLRGQHRWGWLSRGLQALSSPGLAVASGLALVIVMTGALLLAMNASGPGGVANEPEGTIAALADVPVPTQAPTETPVPEPTATQTPRVIQPAQTDGHRAARQDTGAAADRDQDVDRRGRRAGRRRRRGRARQRRVDRAAAHRADRRRTDAGDGDATKRLPQTARPTWRKARLRRRTPAGAKAAAKAAVAAIRVRHKPPHRRWPRSKRCRCPTRRSRRWRTLGTCRTSPISRCRRRR